jgi:SAM-dependent methyltransferase
MAQKSTSPTTSTKPAKSSTHKVADQYNDPDHNYLHYWDGREYEHAAEEIAIRRLLRGGHFKHAVDIGGGYGRLCLLLENYADKVTLAEPSQKQLDIAADFLKDHPEVDRKLMQADDLTFKDGTVDLLTMIRVMHHIPRGEKMPVKPIDIRSEAHKKDGDIAFVNHNPHTVIRQLEHSGLRVVTTLSVSNLRSVRLKKILPREVMLGAERAVQRPLATMFFGPSIFFLVKKSN